MYATISYRNADGSFGPPEPLIRGENTGGEDAAIEALSKIFARRLHEHMNRDAQSESARPESAEM